VGGKITEMIRAQGFHQFPEGGLKDPFEWTYNLRPDSGGLFEWFASNDEQKDYFDNYMAARREGSQLQWFDIYPAAERLKAHPVGESNGVLLCDVGGGQGHEAVKFQERYPDLQGRIVLQDLPRTLQGLNLPKRIEQMPHDFFTPQPIRSK
jgi:hypothetical protein